jgi:hypothetical protein
MLEVSVLSKPHLRRFLIGCLDSRRSSQEERPGGRIGSGWLTRWSKQAGSNHEGIRLHALLKHPLACETEHLIHIGPTPSRYYVQLILWGM